MAEKAARAARVELVANACARSFAETVDFEARMAELKAAGELQRSAMLQTEGWVTLPGMDKPLAAAALVCAHKLADIQPDNVTAARPGRTDG